MLKRIFLNRKYKINSSHESNFPFWKNCIFTVVKKEECRKLKSFNKIFTKLDKPVKVFGITYTDYLWVNYQFREIMEPFTNEIDKSHNHPLTDIFV
jgi:hypothetical protein